MVKKFQAPLTDAVKESAQQIWLAGLGAFARAQEEGGKVFENLVKEGVNIQRKTQAVAEERMSEATSKMSSMANDMQAKAANPWDKLESIFEERVAKALAKLGIPSAAQLEALSARIQALEDKPAPAARKAAAPAKKAAAKKAAARKAA